MGSRIPPRPREDLSEQEQKTYDEFTTIAEQGFGKNKEKFTYKDDRDAFVGPYALLTATPKVGKLAMELVYAIGELELPADVKETAILTCGGHFQAKYELYAHEAIATKSGVLTQQQVDAIKKDLRPGQLNENCSLAYDVTKRLCSRPGPLPQELWDSSIGAFGKEGTIALVHYVGFYAYLCIALNAVDVPVPE
ncbi:hypothetical protein DOTSEDRAFT_69151 [Dothistroma septosporum NZE10]|uniref:Carboxymuconolactone decarboxylase-like domain-containing protein n=1 Tax=Dothistroma septosporum (strain NZE10 / CBS 128990) TaxID=675120 RepID=N1PVW9_DOTSN|nr:hypothetical protein DOTSEDRAFT_69151 [Dothistroma septosporum NZE10]